MIEYDEKTEKLLDEIDRQHNLIVDSLIVSAEKLGTPNTTIKHADLVKLQNEISKINSMFAKQKDKIVSVSSNRTFVFKNPADILIIKPIT